MIRRLGYVGIALGIDATTNRTCRLANATPAHLRSLIAANLAGLAEVLRYNARLNVRLFRISSQVVPFASHPVNTLRWWEEFGRELASLGEFARSQGMRLSMHPSHYTALSSPRVKVVDAAIADLVYHQRFLDAIGLGPEHKVILHGGGTYGDKAAAIERFVSVYHRLPAGIRTRLIIENDERSFCVEDVLAISQRTGIPVVFDALHDLVLPSPSFPDRRTLLEACFATWTRKDGIPKVHFSSQDPAKRAGAHADWVDPDAFLAFAQDAGATPIDCMLEAKKKELALLQLREDLARRGARAIEAA